MNRRAQQIAIAKAAHNHFELHPTDLNLMADGDGGWKEIPDYLHDLNAIHEATFELTPKQRSEYCSVLVDVANAYVDFQTVEANAAERCEAFLKTLNLWTP